MQKVEERPLLNVLENYIDIWNFGDHAHEHSDVGVAQDALHHNLVLDFVEKLVSKAWVEDLLDSHGGTVELALVYH